MNSIQLTNGRPQPVVNSVALYLVIRDYCNTPHARYAAALRPYLPALRSDENFLCQDTHFKVLLQEAESDPMMSCAKDTFFKRIFASTLKDS